METSALVSWLFDEPRGPEAGAWIDAADGLAASDLTFVEGHRATSRQQAMGLVEPDAARLRAELDRLAGAWWVLPLSAPIGRRAGLPFKVEPVRSLDAIHVATALEVQSTQRAPIVFLSLDRRVRINALAHGFIVAPEPTEEERVAAVATSRPGRPR